MPASVPLGVAGLHIESGDHLCAFYQGSDQRDLVLYPYLWAGLEAGDKVVCAVDTTEPDDVLRELGTIGDVTVPVATGQLEVRRSLETYLPDRLFSKDAMLEFWDTTMRGALASGYTFARAVGEMTWAMAGRIGVVELVDYEATLNRFLSQYPQVIVCLYDLEGLPGEVLVDLLRTHPRVLLGGSVHDNPFYVAPDDLPGEPDVSVPAWASPEQPGLVGGREQMSSLRALLLLSAVMTEQVDETQILRLAVTSVPAFGNCQVVAVHLDGTGWTDGGTLATADRPAVLARLRTLDRAAGSIDLPSYRWAWSFPLPSPRGPVGHLVVAADTEPSDAEQFFVGLLVQQLGSCLANARLHRRERAAADELLAANLALEQTVEALEQATSIHERFTRVATAGDGREGIARAAYELTGLPCVIEDRHGNLRASAGPAGAEPYPKEPPERRAERIARLVRAGRPTREGDRLVVAVAPRADVLGLIALVDPQRIGGERELTTLEHGATVLALELVRLQSLAETELRLRRDLVEDLLAGTDDDSATLRADALGYDLERPHRVVVVEVSGRPVNDDASVHAVRRASRTYGPSLIVARGGQVVLLSAAHADWEAFRQAVQADLGGQCRVGVGDWWTRVADVPRSHAEGRLALQMTDGANGRARATEYEHMGVYRLLSAVGDSASVERFITQWLGPLLDYDTHKGTELVPTLRAYLECGGGYDATARRLSVHRNTVKYRLQRIRDVSGMDITDPDTAFNLQLAMRAQGVSTSQVSNE